MSPQLHTPTLHNPLPKSINKNHPKPIPQVNQLKGTSLLIKLTADGKAVASGIAVIFITGGVAATFVSAEGASYFFAAFCTTILIAIGVAAVL